jgi:FixJ family two-component response regulator
MHTEGIEVAAESVVFVIDDDPSVRAAIADLLQSVGLAVGAYESVNQFLRCERPKRPPASCSTSGCRA